MNCNSCSRQTLSLFIRTFVNAEIGCTPRYFSSAARRLQQGDEFPPSSRDRFPSSRGGRYDTLRGGRDSSPRSDRYIPLRDDTPSASRGNSFPSSARDRFPSSTQDRFPSSRGDRFPSSRGGRFPLQARKPVEERTTWRENTMAFNQTEERPERPHWQIQKAALKEKLNGEAWNPRKKLSPDTQEGIRHLHQTHPEKFTTAVLADNFRVSPEAIRRILKSYWRPSDEEAEERLARWDKRGEKIWSNMVELGLKPPKKWREMGVGSAKDGKKPRWKTGSRNSVPMNDSFSEDIIPTVDGSFEESRPPKAERVPLFDRIL
jgi:hypothetical protein